MQGPHKIVSDSLTHFEGEANDVMEEYGIQRHKSSDKWSSQSNKQKLKKHHQQNGQGWSILVQ